MMSILKFNTHCIVSIVRYIMKLGDLVRVKDDVKSVWGFGLVTENMGHRVRVLWNKPDFYDDPYEVLWKVNLEVVSEAL